MKLLQIMARGFKGFNHGLGLKEVKLALSHLTGLIAISGPIGTGKTTLLELCTPFRVFASRDGKMSDHVFLRDSVKDLTIEHNGHQYQCIVKIDCDSGKCEGFIFEDGESLVSGKAREYDKKIVELFGSPELFFSSVFCAQNAPKMSDMTVGEIKGLFSEFLQLDQLAAWEQQSKDLARDLVNSKSGMEAEMQQLELDRDVPAAVEVERHAVAQRDISSIALVRLKTEKEKLEAELAQAKTADQKNEVLRERLKAQNLNITESVDRSSTWVMGQNTELEGLRGDAKTLIAEIAEGEGLAAKLTSIDAAEAEQKLTGAKILEIEDKLLGGKERKAETETDESDEQKKKGAALLRRVTAEKDPEVPRLTTALSTAREDAKALENLSPNCTDPDCALRVKAATARDSIPGLEQQLAFAKVKQKEALGNANADIERSDKSIQVCQLRGDDHSATITRCDSDLVVLRERAQAETALIASRAGVVTAIARRTTQQADLVSIKEKGVSQAFARDKRVISDNQAIEELRKLAKATGDAIDHDAEQQIESISATLACQGTGITNQQTLVTSAEEAVVTARIRLEQTKKNDERHAVLSTQLQTIDKDAAEWRYIQDACGKNGIQALEIDGVAPAITAYANKLLNATAGPLFSVSIRTQDEETGKERFDILVIREDGSETLLEHLSGGQKVWVLKALRLAMTLISKEKSGHNFRTAFGDEEDGSLDVDSAQAFCAMYRQFMEEGGFDTFIFISHRPECVAMADHVITLSWAEGIQVE